MAADSDNRGLDFSARLRLLRNKRYEDWWHIVFGGPIGIFFAALIANIRWITPNQLTILAFLANLGAAAALLCRDFHYDLVAVAALQLAIVLDIMDGSLARYRKRPSAVGAFLDKIFDGIGLAVVCGVLGYRAYLETGEVLPLIAGLFIGSSYLARCYMYWVVAYIERDLEAGATVGPRSIRPFGELGFAERLVYYLRATWRIVMVGQGDVAFWVSLFLLLGRVEDLVVPLAGAYAFWLVAIFARRLNTAISLDRHRPHAS